MAQAAGAGPLPTGPLSIGPLSNKRGVSPDRPLILPDRGQDLPRSPCP